MELPDFRELMEQCCDIAVTKTRGGIHRPIVGSLIWHDGEVVSDGFKRFERFFQRSHGRSKREMNRILRPEMRNRKLRRTSKGDFYADVLHHAEETVFDKLDGGNGYDPRSAILFTTLEPCVPGSRDGYGRVGVQSCSELIVKSGIKRVVVGDLDFTRSVETGAGINYLSHNGVEVHYDKSFSKFLRRKCNYASNGRNEH
jgi:pyrimidine deaminase RibD-like protein